MQIQGTVHTFGDNVDTDVIIPARYLNIASAEELSTHCMEDIDPAFTQKVAKGDVICAGDNFGCGSSREHAPLTIKTCGIACVVAKSFARIFYRNAINIGLPILECPAAVEDAKAGDVLKVDLDTGTVENVTRGKKYAAAAFPLEIQKIIAAGGLLKTL